MLIAFEAAVFDPIGAIVIEANPDSQLDTSTRRVTRTATLDGNAAIVDMGYTAADSTLSVSAYLTQAEERTLLRLMRIYPEVVASTSSGCYLGVIDDLRRDTQGTTQIQFTIQRSLSLVSDL
jgi:hypothetical protein